MKGIILGVCTAAAVALGAAGCSSERTDAADVNGACQEAVGEWTALYDAFAAKTSRKDPDQMAVVTVRDDARRLQSTIEAACERDVATGVAETNREMIGVLKAINACEFVEECGNQVVDQVDKTMAALERVRSLVK